MNNTVYSQATDSIQTTKAFINQAINILTEIDALNQQLKDLKDAGKEQGFDVPFLVNIAKAEVQGKLDELLEKTVKQEQAIEEYRSQWQLIAE